MILYMKNALKYTESLIDLYFSVEIVLYFDYLIEILWIIMPGLILFLITIPCILLLYWSDDKRDSKEIVGTQRRLWKWEFLYENYFPMNTPNF